MKIGVSGASGHLGRAVVSELLQRPDGHEVVAITGLDRLLIISTVDLEPGKRGAHWGGATKLVSWNRQN